MRKKRFTKVQIDSLLSLNDRLSKLRKEFADRDVTLHYGNGSVLVQLDCMAASLDCIFQEL